MDVRLVRGLRREVSPLDDVRAFFALVGEFRKFRPDVVHTHMAKAGMLGRIAARVSGVPVVVHTFHGNVLRGYFGPRRSTAFSWLERLLALLSTRIVTLSPRQSAEIVALAVAPASKLTEVPLGVDLVPLLTAERGALRRELGIAAGVPLIGTVARLVPIKAVDTFIQAAAVVARQRSDARFVVAGDGPLRAPLEELARTLGLKDRLVFLGWRADLPAIYGDLDVVVLTSRNEGFPVSLIEALAARCAVVATAVGGVPDLIRDGINGYLVQPDDPNAVARAVENLLRSPDLRTRMGVAGRDSVYPAYDASAVVANMSNLYRDLVNGRGGARADRAP